MILWEAFRTALRALVANKVRSTLTMLGVIIGVSSITSLVGIGQGLKQDITAQITDLGANILFILPGQVRTEGGGFNPSASVGASTLTEEDIVFLRRHPDVVSVTPVSLLAGLPQAGDRTAPSTLTLAVESAYFELNRSAELVAGRIFSDEEIGSNAPVVILDRGPREALFPDIAPGEVLGKTISFKGQSLTVVGILETPPSTGITGGNATADAMYLPYTTAKATIENTQIFRIAVRTREDADIKTVASSVRDGLKAEHDGAEDFSVLTQEDLLDVIDEILDLLTTAVSGIGAISLLVGGIGIMNIMLVSVTERTKEIGVRKALGASRGNILVQFLLEAILLSVLGGAIGIGLAFAASFPIKSEVGLTLLLNPFTVSLAFGFSVLVGVIFGVAPALRASRLNPVDALRYE